MQRMFRSAQLKLTAWYLLILTIISLIFSIAIYQINYSEVSLRLENLQQSLIDTANPVERHYLVELFTAPDNPLRYELRQASAQIILSLLYANITLLAISGVGAYFLARRTLLPLEAAHEAQSRFTSDASHELRTPLAAMKTELEVSLQDKNLTAEESKEILQSNLEEVEKLISLSEMLLHLSRLDHGKLEREILNLSSVVESIIERYPHTQKKRIAPTLRRQLLVRANNPAISELVTILVDNALRYSPDDSQISVRVYEKRGYATLTVHNTGKPIPAEALPKLFDRFFRADTSRTDGNKNGYGLGLSIAKKIADVHHGELTVQSGTEGTTFTYTMLSARRTSTPVKSS